MIVPTTQKSANHQQLPLDASPMEWADERDGVFFRITASLFPADFVYGASVLLASYDAE